MNTLGDTLPHTAFLRDMQNWVWKRFPTLQLSASDIFYAMQWAETGVPSIIFIDGFENWLQTHPKEFVSDARFSALRFEADRIITAYRLVHPQTAESAFKAEDPFEQLLTRIEQIGKQATDERLLKELRQIYQTMRGCQRESQQQYPDWQTRSEAFYTYKARMLIQWDECIETLMHACLSWLSQEKCEQMHALSAEENMHLLYLGDEAQELYRKRRIHEKVADYYGIRGLLDSV